MAVQYRPFERRTLEDLLAASQSGLDPSLSYSIFSDIRQGALDRLTNQRAVRMDRRGQRQDLMSAFGGQLTEAALGGVPPEGLEALAGIQTSANPMLGRVVGGGLDDLLANAGALSTSMPGATADPGMMSEELATIDATATANIQATQQGDTNSGFYDTLALLRRRWEAMGLDPDTIRNLRDYFAEAWQSQGGVIPGAPGVTDPTPGGAGGLLNAIEPVADLLSPLTALPRRGLEAVVGSGPQGVGPSLAGRVDLEALLSRFRGAR